MVLDNDNNSIIHDDDDNNDNNNRDNDDNNYSNIYLHLNYVQLHTMHTMDRVLTQGLQPCMTIYSC